MSKMTDEFGMPIEERKPITIGDVLEKLYEEGSFEGEHRDIHPDRIEEAKQALFEIILGMKPKKKLVSKENGFNIGFNQGVDEYERRIKDVFK